MSKISKTAKAAMNAVKGQKKVEVALTDAQLIQNVRDLRAGNLYVGNMEAVDALLRQCTSSNVFRTAVDILAEELRAARLAEQAADYAHVADRILLNGALADLAEAKDAIRFLNPVPKDETVDDIDEVSADDLADANSTLL